MKNIVSKVGRQGIWILLVGTIQLHAEPSVYGFGSDESTDTPQMPMSSNRTTASLQQQIVQQAERIDGLTTVIEGLSASIHELQQSRAAQPASFGDAEVPESDLLKKLAAMIDEINANYVSKAELQEALGQKSTGKKPETTPVTKVAEDQSSVEGKSNDTLYSEGVRFFVKQRYDEAEKRFTITDRKGYKPAASNYYLGEIAYYTKKYEDAIFYFKKSAGLYDKASYIDTLLLHTAISLENTGDKGQARIFYENIIENYAGKKTAKIAQDRLKKL
ncbi:MAG TPA: hypothetical protein VIM88_03945 [Sulfurovum sp.]|uniref:tetratricopeptide repeat protein n=1 Tax=Sulfurovum sp. TaxID=1969726 RepID=UPI002F93AEB1